VDATSVTRKTLLFASYLEPEFVARIQEVDQRLDVLYRPDLLASPRYPGDHGGGGFVRTPEQEAEWRAMLNGAHILFDFDRPNAGALPQLAPHLEWIQATSAGIGEFVRRHGYAQSMPQVVVTTASGVHAQPLAEFCFMAMIAFHKRLPEMLRDQRRKHWERFAGGDLRDQVLVVVGVGGVGREVARIGRAYGMRVIGVKRSPSATPAHELNADVLYGQPELHRALEQAQNLVLIAPHTSETEGMIGARELALLPRNAVVINIGRGALVDEDALISALQSGHLLGAALDVFREEPLPPTSPLWSMDNVIVSPHSASTSIHENDRITALFCDNLRRFLDGLPLRNQFGAERGF
jgi:phosphoglycerate dehydrogenase-like enzyme